MKQTAIVTGGSRGIGLAIAKRLGQDGFQVVVVGVRPAEAVANSMDMLAREQISCCYVQADIAVQNDRERIIEQAVKRFGSVHVLVNNAGVAPHKRADLLEMTEESFDRVIGINTKSTMFLTQAVAKQMLTQTITAKKRGTIINISSCSAAVSSTGRGEYCVSKAGLSMLTTLYADRLAGDGIMVHEVRPGIIATDMTAGVQQKYDDLIAAGAFPIARWGTPEDVAGAVAAFAGEMFLYTTGNYIDVDGGFHIKRL